MIGTVSTVVVLTAFTMSFSTPNVRSQHERCDTAVTVEQAGQHNAYNGYNKSLGEEAV